MSGNLNILNEKPFKHLEGERELYVIYSGELKCVYVCGGSHKPFVKSL